MARASSISASASASRGDVVMVASLGAPSPGVQPGDVDPTVARSAMVVAAKGGEVAYLERDDGAALYFEDVGQGPPIITTHGLTENGTYWSLPAVTARLALHHRVVSLDMR